MDVRINKQSSDLQLREKLMNIVAYKRPFYEKCETIQMKKLTMLYLYQNN